MAGRFKIAIAKTSFTYILHTVSSAKKKKLRRCKDYTPSVTNQITNATTYMLITVN